MTGEFPFSRKKPSHRIGDFRMSKIQLSDNFLLIASHNRNIREVKRNLISFFHGATRKFSENGTAGILTELKCSGTRKVIVKTYRDGTCQVLEEN